MGNLRIAPTSTSITRYCRFSLGFVIFPLSLAYLKPPSSDPITRPYQRQQGPGGNDMLHTECICVSVSAPEALLY
ncbi:hypothetical protein J3E69DRAFT_331580 [Trichoderma sp. SZMC 28015]